jgi:hypothetical protein
VNRAPRRWRREVLWFAEKATGKSVLAKSRRWALLACVYNIWQERKKVVFRGETISLIRLIQSVKNSMILQFSFRKGHILREEIGKWI